VDGAVVLSLRGGDFAFDCGQDLSIGYQDDDAEAVHLYIQESFGFVVATPGIPPDAARLRGRRPVRNPQLY